MILGREILRAMVALLDGDAHPVLSTLLRSAGGILVVLFVIQLLGA
ncbi:MAG: hypothetical protein AAB570_01710 [Patescibacteria group bacterium]